MEQEFDLVECPDCAGMVDDSQYTCTTCWCEGGDGVIKVRRPTKYAPDMASAASAEPDSSSESVPAVESDTQPRGVIQPLGGFLMSQKCSYDPSPLIDVPLGMFHCPECGEMVLAGMAHPDYSLAVRFTGNAAGKN